MIAGVLQYAFAQAKTRAMKGNLLDREDWHYLAGMKGLDEFLRYLSGTAYGRALAGCSGAHRDVRMLVHGLYEDLFQDYARIMKAVPATGARLIRSLVDRYDGENLKILLRGIWRSASPPQTRSLLYPLDSLSKLPVDGLLQVNRVEDSVALLGRTVFHVPLVHALPQFKARGRLFPIEIAIDMAAFHRIIEAVKAVETGLRGETRALAGELIDSVNLSWIVRFRHFYGLSPEEAINYTLPGGFRLGLDDLGKLARASDIPSFLAALPNAYQEALRPADRWQAIRVLCQRWLVGRLHRVFQSNPFQIKLQVSYLLLKEMEVKSLESFLSALELGGVPQKVSALVSPPIKGDAFV